MGIKNAISLDRVPRMYMYTWCLVVGGRDIPERYGVEVKVHEPVAKMVSAKV